MSDIEIRPATPSRWDDVCTVFGTKGDPSWCWCQFFVTTGSGYEESATANKSALHDQLRSRPAPGLLAYRDGVPVGWVQVGPVGRYPRVTGNTRRHSVLGDDPEGLWRITCFVVPVSERRSGVATALLDGAIAHARAKGGRVLEGHPVDTAGKRSAGASLFHGVLSSFLAAGFGEVARTGSRRPVVRLDL